MVCSFCLKEQVSRYAKYLSAMLLAKQFSSLAKLNVIVTHVWGWYHEGGDRYTHTQSQNGSCYYANGKKMTNSN